MPAGFVAMKHLTFLKIGRIALVVSTVLQIAAFCLPGWLILSVTSSDLEAKHGLDFGGSGGSEVGIRFSVWYMVICAYMEQYDHDNDYSTPDQELDECKAFTYAEIKDSFDTRPISNFLSTTITASSGGFFSLTQWQVELTVALVVILVLIGLVEFQLRARVAYEEGRYTEPPHKAVYICTVLLAIVELVLLGIPTFTVFWTNIHVLKSDYAKEGLVVGIPYALIVSFCALLALTVAGECLEKLCCRVEESPVTRPVSQAPVQPEKHGGRGKHNSAAEPESVPMYTYNPSCLQYLNEQPSQPMMQHNDQANQPMMQHHMADPGQNPYREYKMYPPKSTEAV